MWNWIEKVDELAKDNEPFVMVTVVRTHGSTPRKVGARMVVTGELETYGTIGGGKLELLVLADANRCLRNGGSRLERYDLCHKTGQCCGGVVEVFMEVHAARPQLYIFGAGHIGGSLARTMAGTSFDVHVIDARADWIESDELPREATRHAAPWSSFVESAEFSAARTHVIVVTPSHATDRAIVEAVAGKPTRSIGMVGSKLKWARFRKELEASGVPTKALQRVHSPVGIDIGAETPQEIAISIAAHLLKTLHNEKRAVADEPALAVQG